MIFRPVRPESPWGPPTTNRPVGFTRMRVFSSSRAAGMLGFTTSSIMSARICSRLASAACWVDSTTVSTRTGLPSSPYSTVTWLLPSGRR